MPDAYLELETSVAAALESYANVHRGSGHHSLVTTRLFEQARAIVLETLGLDPRTHVVVFGTPRRIAALRAQLPPGEHPGVSSQDLGLPLGVRALAVRRRALPRGVPSQVGGGTARLVSPGSVVWARVPDRFEPGTPAIVNVIALARALRLVREQGRGCFADPAAGTETAAGILHRDDLEALSGPALLAALRQTLIGREVKVPTRDGLRPFINLDNGASTPTFEPIWTAVRKAWRQPAAVQQEIAPEVRSVCAGFLGAPLASHEVVFTSNTTEAINLVAENLGLRADAEVEPVVLDTLLEHNSNDLPYRRVPGLSLIRLTVDREGFVDLKELDACLADYNQAHRHGQQRIQLVAVSGASNVLGTCNDLAEIARIAHRHGAHLLVDAAQLVAHRPIRMEDWGIDYLVFSAHKAYAPFGTGVLVARRGLLAFGPEARAEILASGEENVAGIAALGKALVLLQRIGMDVIQAEEQALTAQLLRGLAQIPGLRVHGITDPDSPRFARKGGVVVFELKGLMPDRVARELAERGGIGVRFGCHCAHLLIKHLLDIGPVLQRFQSVIVTLFPGLNLPGLTRVSLGLENTPEDIDVLLRVLGELARKPRLPRTDVAKQLETVTRAAVARVYPMAASLATEVRAGARPSAPA